VLVAVAGLLIAAVVGWQLFGIIRILSAYKAKILCSGFFVAHRPVSDVLATDLALDSHRWLTAIPANCDLARREVRAGWGAPLQGIASFRPGAGCTLIYPALGPAVTAAPSEAVDAVRPLPSGEEEPLPVALDSGLNAELNRLMAPAFDDEADPIPPRTRAIVILHRDRIVAERYAHGFGPETPLAGWSMAKTALNALTGVLVQQGVFALTDVAPVPEWAGSDDPRGRITIGQLLRMTSGLRFSETYRDPLEDVLQMLFVRADSAAFAAAQPLDAPPGSRWQYSGGTSNILGRLLRARLDPTGFADAPRRLLFDPLGMRTATLERDAAGNYVASSFMYASARDWARLGLLFLHDGVWRGRRLLPEGWVAYSRTPTLQSPNGEFGAHLWLRVPPYYQDPAGPAALPDDAFHAIGHEGQFVSVIPSRRLVVARLGLTRHAHAWRHDRFLAQVIAAVDPRPE